MAPPASAPPARPQPATAPVALSPAAGVSAFPGRPFPLGAHPDGDGTNFSVYADATHVELCLVSASGEEIRYPMEERTFGLWHRALPGVGAGQRYGYRVHDRDGSKILLDPYARRVDTTAYDPAAAATPGVDTLGVCPLGLVTDPVRARRPRPFVPWEHTVVYEAHVKGLTRNHPGVPAAQRGTYLGACHPAVVEHLQSLQVTALELLPVHAHATEPGLLRTGRTNYWGYCSLSYFALHPDFAGVRGQEMAEFATMVDTLHDAGIEVILDVVYNHTCEGGPDGAATLSWRGLAPDTYYLPSGRDITGTGNTVDPARLPAVRMVTDSLRYFAEEFAVDGFRFDLASVLGRPRGGAFDPDAALLTAIAADPVLAGCKLIAEPWDATGEGYAVGRFGSQFAEWNDHYRDTVRDFWRGSGGVRDMGYRLSGSSDLYGGRGPWASVNFVTAHDGFTLRDLVSYTEPHNLANGENNQDGTRNNRSSGYGAEGATDDPAVRSVRLRQARNLAASLLLSTGTPMITMGDELWRTQGGNNNAYCQDNPTSWLDWTGALDPAGNRAADRPAADGAAAGHGGAADGATAEPGQDAADLLAFFRHVAAVRAQSPALRQREFFEGRAPSGGDGLPDLVWFRPDGQQMTDADWFDGGRQSLLAWFDGRDVRGRTPQGDPQNDDSWLLVLHAGTEPGTLTVPGPPYGEAYTLEVDTGEPTGRPAQALLVHPGTPVPLPARTLWLLRAHRDQG